MCGQQQCLQQTADLLKTRCSSVVRNYELFWGRHVHPCESYRSSIRIGTAHTWLHTLRVYGGYTHSYLVQVFVHVRRSRIISAAVSRCVEILSNAYEYLVPMPDYLETQADTEDLNSLVVERVVLCDLWRCVVGSWCGGMRSVEPHQLTRCVLLLLLFSRLFLHQGVRGHSKLSGAGALLIGKPEKTKFGCPNTTLPN